MTSGVRGVGESAAKLWPREEKRPPADMDPVSLRHCDFALAVVDTPLYTLFAAESSCRRVASTVRAGYGLDLVEVLMEII